MSEYELYKFQKQAIEKRQFKQQVVDLLSEIMVLVTTCANANNQTVGEKNDLYVTLEQLENLCKQVVDQC